MKKSLADVNDSDLRGRRVAVRVDFNVPLSGGAVSDPTRIARTLPTLRRLVSAGARTVLLSHLGRPKGAPDPAFSLAPVAEDLRTRLDATITFVPESVGVAATQAVESLSDGDVVMLENTRFLPGETNNDAEVAEAWANLADLYVNDAFGTAHRAHASTDGLPRAVRAKGGDALAGLLMEKELRFLGAVLDEPKRPFVAVLGGAKISGKIDVIEALLPKIDTLLIGGAMANTFFRALGLETGKSLVEDEKVQVARELLDRGGDRLILPIDAVVGDAIAADAVTQVVARSDIPVDSAVGDIGPDSVALFAARIEGASTVVWNGPMGVFEMAPFASGTFGVAEAAAAAADAGATVVLGGGDSAAAAEAAGVSERVTHVSTGGGASLEFLAGAQLPGVDALSDQSPSESGGSEA